MNNFFARSILNLKFSSILFFCGSSKNTVLGAYWLHRSTKYEVVIVIEIAIVISEVTFDVETESGLRIAPSRQVLG